MTVTQHFDSRTTSDERIAARYSIAAESYSPGLSVVRVAGDLDMTARVELASALDEASSGTTVVLLDLSAVAFMYSGAASVIIDAADRCAGRLEVFAPTRPARMVLEALGAAAIVTTRPKN